MTRTVRASVASLALAALLFTGVASAGGRAACSVQLGFDPRIRCFAEETLFTLGPFEVGAGAYWEPLKSGIPYPYTVLGWYSTTWWVVVEVGKPLHDRGWLFALSAGFRW